LNYDHKNQNNFNDIFVLAQLHEPIRKKWQNSGWRFVVKLN